MSPYLPARLRRIESILACPACQGSLTYQEGAARCETCHKEYKIKNDKIYFVSPLAVDDELDSIKSILKNKLKGLYYSVGIPLFAPVYPFNYIRSLRPFVDLKEQTFIDLGSGNRRIDENVITLDAIDYEDVDLVADVYALPFKTDSVDAFGSRGLLEHIPDVMHSVAEIRRCTRVGGLSAHQIPFMFPYHASPHDYQRFTHTGAANLFANWEVLSQQPSAGPVSLILLTVIETLSLLLSFGHKGAQAFLYLALCGFLFPLKLLDAPFVGRKAFLTLAPSIFTVVKKRQLDAKTPA